MKRSRKHPAQTAPFVLLPMIETKLDILRPLP